MKFFIKKYTALAVLGLSLAGCKKDFLNKINPNFSVEATFWQTEADAVSAIPTIYSPIRSQMDGYYGAWSGYQMMNRADDMWMLAGEGTEGPTFYVHFLNTATSPTNQFGSLFTGVSRANTFLKNIGRVSMDDTKKKALIGEASFLRGMYYFLLAANYGDVPLRLLPASDPGELNKASSPEADIWKQVIADFRTAKDALPVSRPASEQGRATKGAAIAYLGKALVYTKQYADAETELNALLSAPYNYDLVNFENNFMETTKFNQESVFELAYNAYLGGGGRWGGDEPNGYLGFVLPNFCGPAGSGAWFKLVPGISMVRDFVSEERPAGSDTRFDKRMYTSFFWKYSDYETGLTDGKWFGDHDFDYFWQQGQGKWVMNPGLVYPDINTAAGKKPGRFLLKKYTNFYINKEGSNSHYDNANCNNNLRIIRFAEVLLLHAEACAQNGNTAGAAADLKRIRDRAGLANKTWGSKDELMTEIIKQNELEFFFEGHRFFDLKRWYTPAQMKQILVNNQQQGAENFQPKHYYIPIPQSELNTNTSIQQNPLWK
ncbi:MAG: RagB/SusD family nutrient uptake outer membrane protein [Niabella sp.]|nr:RagB/SusD family nutrient uptake outer membrane protein [Niabella sp.]